MLKKNDIVKCTNNLWNNSTVVRITANYYVLKTKSGLLINVLKTRLEECLK